MSRITIDIPAALDADMLALAQEAKHATVKAHVRAYLQAELVRYRERQAVETLRTATSTANAQALADAGTL